MMHSASVLVQWDWRESDWLGQTSVEARDQAWKIFGRFTKGPAGRFPETGMTKLRLYYYSDSCFKAQYGGKVLPENDPDKFP